VQSGGLASSWKHIYSQVQKIQLRVQNIVIAFGRGDGRLTAQ
jgi:hypothetical protein